MTRKEAMRQNQQTDTLRALGFTSEEAEQLRRISMTLHRWYERECGNDHCCIVRGHKVDGEFTYDDNGEAYEEHSGSSGVNRYYRIPDRETGAKKRLATILQTRNDRIAGLSAKEYWKNGGFLTSYLQTDPRGAVLYLLRPGDVPEGKNASSYYTRGICIY